MVGMGYNQTRLQQLGRMEMPQRSPNINMNINHMKEEEERLIKVSATNRQRVIRNNLYLIFFLNLFTILMFIFSMGFYRWLQIQFQVNKKETATAWINLLYVYNSNYLSFSRYASNTCDSVDDLCTSILEQLSFVGAFCFLIFLVAHVLQLIDIFVFMWKICKKLPLTASNFFRQVFIICTFAYGLCLYVFSIAVIKNVNRATYGVCMYLNMLSVVLLIAVVVYEQISIRKMMKAELVLQLLEGQKQFDTEQSDKYSINRHSDSFVL